MSDIQNELKALINKTDELKNRHIKSLVGCILKKTDFCLKYDINEAKAQLLAKYYIEDDIAQFRNLLMFGREIEEYDFRYMPNIFFDIPGDSRVLFKSTLCPEILSHNIKVIDMELYK